MAKLSIPGFFAGLAHVQAGAERGRFEAQQLQRQRALQEQSQTLDIFSHLAGLERQQQEADIEPLRLAAGAPNLAPESQQALFEAMLQMRQGAQYPAADQLRGYLQSRLPGGNAGMAQPGRTTSQTGPYGMPAPAPGVSAPRPVLPELKFRNPRLAEEYAGPIAARERALQSGELTDEGEAAYVARELEALRAARDRGTPLNQARVGGFMGVGVPVRPSLPPARPDKATTAYERAQATALQERLRKYVSSFPAGSQERKLAEEQALPFLQRAGSLKFDTAADLEQARMFRSDPAHARLQVANDPGTESFADRAYRIGLADYDQQLQRFLGGPNVAPLSPGVARTALPGLLKQERALVKLNKGAIPYLASQGAEIDRLDAINAMLEDPRLPAQERETRSREAELLAQGVMERLKVGMSPNEEKARFDQALRALSGMSLVDARGEGGKALFTDLGIGHLWQPGLSDARADKLYDELLAKAPSIARLDRAGQKLFIDRLQGVSRLTGRPIELDADFVFKLAPTDQAKLAMDRSRLQLQGEKLSVAKARFALDQAEAKGKLAQATVKIDPRDTLLLNEDRRKLGVAQKDYETSLATLRKSGDAFWAGFDPEEVSRRLQSGEPLTPGVPLTDSGFWSGVDGFFSRMTGQMSKTQRAQAAVATREQRYAAVAKDLIGKFKRWRDAESGYVSRLNQMAGEGRATVTPSAQSPAAPAGAPPGSQVPKMNPAGTNRAKFENTLRLRGLSEALIKQQADAYYPPVAGKR